MDVFRRTGRGGAGNYISQKEVEEAEKAQQANVSHVQLCRVLCKACPGGACSNIPRQDPESQRADASTTAAAMAAASQPPQYVRVGRGGAGNYSEPPTIADSHDRKDVVDRTAAAVSASQAGKPRTGLTGRGGAGNWTYDGEKQDGPEQDEAEQQRIADKIKHDIDASLPPPPKTYHQHDRDME